MYISINFIVYVYDHFDNDRYFIFFKKGELKKKNYLR